MSASNLPALSSQPPPPTVSWPSIFIALVALVLNNLIQPSGIVLSLPFLSSCSLRTSPITCALETVSLGIHFLSYCATGYSPRSSARLIRSQRGMDVDMVDSKHAPTSRRLKRISGRSRLLVFIFGAVPQYAKIMSMSGIPWTQACASTYMASFIVFEMFNRVGTSTGTDDAYAPFKEETSSGELSPPHASLTKVLDLASRSLGYFGCSIHTLLWAYAAYALTPASLVDFSSVTSCILISIVALTGGVSVFCFVTIVIPAVPFIIVAFVFVLLTSVYPGILDVLTAVWEVRFIVNPRWRGVVQYLGSLLAFTVIFCIYMFVFMLPVLIFFAEKVMDEWVLRGVVAGWIVGVVTGVHYLFWKLAFGKQFGGVAKMVSGRKGTMQEWRSFHFAVGNAVAGFCYYCWVYDPVGTGKPRWTESLG